MNLKEGNTNKVFEQPSVGTHVARCIKVIDLGTQKGEYQGVATSKHKIMISWELPNELMTEGEYAGKPFAVAGWYTASFHEKSNLRRDLVNWRGREFTEEELQGFSTKNLIGKACMLSVVLNKKGKTEVAGVMALPKGMTVPPQVNPSVHFSLDEDDFDMNVYAALTQGIKAIVDKSPEMRQLLTGKPVDSGETFGQAYNSKDDSFDDSIPF